MYSFGILYRDILQWTTCNLIFQTGFYEKREINSFENFPCEAFP